MPNWAYSEMDIWTDGSDEANEELREFVDETIVPDDRKDSEGNPVNGMRMTFQGVVPRPKSLDITSGSSTDRAISYLKALDGDISDIRKDIKDCKWMWTDDNTFGEKIFNKSDKVAVKVKKYMDWLEQEIEVNELTEAKLALENIDKHGSKDWYDWSIRNWGTKWDACLTHDDVDEDRAMFSFETAWSPPEPWIHAVTKKYPKLRIKVKVTEESDMYMGVITAFNGEMVPNFVDVHWPDDC